MFVEAVNLPTEGADSIYTADYYRINCLRFAVKNGRYYCVFHFYNIYLKSGS